MFFTIQLKILFFRCGKTTIRLKGPKMKKIFITLICLVLCVTALTSCGRPPEYAEVEARFIELVEASYELNEILFGKGLPTYEKHYERIFDVYQDKENNKVWYYYELSDENVGDMLGYRVTEKTFYVISDKEIDGVLTDTVGSKKVYRIDYDDSHIDSKDKKVEQSVDSETGVTSYYYTFEDAEYGKIYEYRRQVMKYLLKLDKAKEGEEPVYSADGVYYYPVDYEEPKYEFYYTDDDPEGYSFVRLDCDYVTIDDIKRSAETVYSADYLKGIYEMLFTGVVITDEYESGKMAARYCHYEDEDGQTWLLSLDGYELELGKKRIYDFSSAKVVRPGNKNFVNIEVESYPEGEPDKRESGIISMVKQEDGKWYLDSPTY